MKRNLLLLVLLVSPMVVFAQGGLSSDQLALLDEVVAAYERQDAWNSYSQFSVTTTGSVLTITGDGGGLWRTVNRSLEANADREGAAARGTITLNEQIGASDATLEPVRSTLEFVALDDRLWVKELPDGDFTAASVEDYIDLGLAELVDFGKRPDVTGWLENTTSIFDLGVEDGLQFYELEIELLPSLRFITFDLEALAQEYNGLVELGRLTGDIATEGTLTLQVGINVADGQLLSVSQEVAVAVEISGEDVVFISSGNGVFQLDYARRQDVIFYDVGEAFEITEP